MPSALSRRFAWPMVVALVAGAAVPACGSSKLADDSDNGFGEGGGSSCLHPEPGCPCAIPGEKADCGYVSKASGGDSVTCAMGKTTCGDDHLWGPCAADHTVIRSTHAYGDVHALNFTILDSGLPCTSPCDPYCNGGQGDGYDVVVPGLVTTLDGALTLEGSAGGFQPFSCGTDAAAQPMITGTVKDPASLNPVMGAIVMIPSSSSAMNGYTLGAGPLQTNVNGTLTATTQGMSDACGGTGLPTAFSWTTTAKDGSFTLAVPNATNVPVLIQAGRWRRYPAVTLDTHLYACSSTTNISTMAGSNCSGLNNYAGSESCNTRLPRAQCEGNIPKIAVATGLFDSMECLLYRMGVSASEFTDELGSGADKYTGRVHVFTNGSYGKLQQASTTEQNTALYAQGGAIVDGLANHGISTLMGFSCPFSQWPAGMCAQDTRGLSNAGFDLSSSSQAPWVATAGGGFVSLNTTSNCASNSPSTCADIFSLPNSLQLGTLTGTISYSVSSTVTYTFTVPAGSGLTDLLFWWNVATASGGGTGTGAATTFTLVDSNGAATVPVTIGDYTSGGTLATGSPPSCVGTAQGCIHDWNNIHPGDTYTLTITNKDNAAAPHKALFIDSLYFSTNPTPAATNLLNNYDAVLLGCAGGSEYSSWNWGSGNDAAGLTNLVSYANSGGRVFTSHWGREWLENVPTATAPWKSVAGAAWNLSSGTCPTFGAGGTCLVAPGAGTCDPSPGTTPSSACSNACSGTCRSTSALSANMVTSGAAGSRQDNFLQWMQTNVTGSGVTTLSIAPARYDVSALATSTTQPTWNYWPVNFVWNTSNEYFAWTFDTPLTGATISYPGRVLYSDMHMAYGSGGGLSDGIFPGTCATQGGQLTAQEQMGEYMLFDKGGCTQPAIATPSGTAAAGFVPTATYNFTWDMTCQPGFSATKPMLYWKDYIAAGSDANIVFTTQTSLTGTAGTWLPSPAASLVTVSLANGNSSATVWTGADVGAALSTAGQPVVYEFITVSMTLNASTDQQTAPTLLGWQFTWDCAASQ